MVVIGPYKEKKLNNQIVRFFDKNVKSEELVWHRDEKTRIVEVLEGENWEFQFDNSLPVNLKVGDVLNIPAKAYHRIKAGTTNLKIKITEVNENE
jgi:quercetin dioxygenase-like cupin family protein